MILDQIEPIIKAYIKLEVETQLAAMRQKYDYMDNRLRLIKRENRKLKTMLKLDPNLPLDARYAGAYDGEQSNNEVSGDTGSREIRGPDKEPDLAVLEGPRDEDQTDPN